MEIVINLQSDNNIISTILAAGSVLAGIGSCAMAFLTLRSIRRQEKRDRPVAAITRTAAVSDVDGAAIVVTNVGAVAFTVIEVGIGNEPFRYYDHFAIVGDIYKNRKGIRTITPGDHARFTITHNNGGLAYAKLADGSVFREDRIEHANTTSDSTQPSQE